jgi:hypothetical protein
VKEKQIFYSILFYSNRIFFTVCLGQCGVGGGIGRGNGESTEGRKDI